MKKNGLAPILIILVILVLGIVGYFVYRDVLVNTTTPPEFGVNNVCPPNSEQFMGNWDTSGRILPKDDNQVCQLDIGESPLTGESASDYENEIKQVNKYPNLKILHLDGNDFSQTNTEIELPSEIWQLKNLQVLTFSGIPLKDSVLAPEIWSLSNLRLLSLSNSNIKSIPPEIEKLNQLVELDVTVGNPGLILPANLGNLKNLERLDLSNNALTKLPDSLSDLKNLKYLDLDDNLLVDFPLAITKLSNLEELHMARNKLVSLPDDIGNLQNIKIITFSNWPIYPVSCGDSVCKRDILAFRKNGNNISKFPETLSKLNNLQELDLTNIVVSDEQKTHLKIMLPNTKIIFDLPMPIDQY